MLFMSIFSGNKERGEPGSPRLGPEALGLSLSHRQTATNHENVERQSHQRTIVPGHQDYEGLPFVADVNSDVDIVSVGLRYRWDDPVVAIPAAPIVRKY